MAKRLEILLNDAEYAAICEAAQRQQMSVSEWVRQAMRNVRQAELTRSEFKRDAQRNDPYRIARKLQAWKGRRSTITQPPTLTRC